MAGRIEPSFDTMYPDVGPKISKIIEKGSWNAACLLCCSQSPQEGLSASIGIV